MGSAPYSLGGAFSAPFAAPRATGGGAHAPGAPVAPAGAGLGERIIKIDLIMFYNLRSKTFQRSTTNNNRLILDHHVTLKNLTLSLTLSLILTLLDLDPDLEDLDPDLGLFRCQGTPTLPSTSDLP